MKILDCTLRDGGYYNSWNFPFDITNQYLEAMSATGVDIVELGLRSLINKGFSGANAYTTDSYLRTLTIPKNLQVAVMVNAVELVGDTPMEEVLDKLFTVKATDSVVDIVRIACHVHEFVKALPACTWLKERGYLVGFNLMQVADRSQEEVENLALQASKYPIDVLYFADSMGSMNPAETTQIIGWLRKHWQGEIGIHTHDNMGLALSNTLQAVKDSATWLDATVTGMGRGPGNSRTEELVIEIAQLRQNTINMIPLMRVINAYFQPLKNQCGWGSNPYYYLSGKYGIHPTYIQQMLADSRYSEEDVLLAIEYLKSVGGKKFSINNLEMARKFYQTQPTGTWNPKTLFESKDVLLLGVGPSVAEHKVAIEQYIKKYKPIVVALNAQSVLPEDLIDVRIACHPTRLLADCAEYLKLPQPLITPKSMLPQNIHKALSDKKLLDYGLLITPNQFEFGEYYSDLPSSSVICYALAIMTAGQANQISMVGFDGYGAGDSRNEEMDIVLKLYQNHQGAVRILSLTPTLYKINTQSIYGLL